MVSLTRQFSAAIIAAYDFGRFATIVDVGGGHGGFLTEVLRANPSVHGVLYDLPHVVAGAPPTLDAAGVADRCEIVGGSFFDDVPAGGDAYVLKSVVHDWEDEQAVEILATCRRAIPSHATLLVLERVLAPPNVGADGKLSDLNMLVAPGGRERTVEEFGDLLQRGGFRLADVIETASAMVVLEASPA